MAGLRRQRVFDLDRPRLTFDKEARDGFVDVPLLFSARADVLLGDLAPAGVESYVLGLLIGGEIAALGARPATLIGSPMLVDHYAAALTLAGVTDVATVDGDTAVAPGLWMIGESL